MLYYTSLIYFVPCKPELLFFWTLYWSITLDLYTHLRIYYDCSMNRLSTEQPVESTVCSLFFSKEIKSDGSFHVPEDCQLNLLYWPLHPELFLYWRVSVFPLHELSFRFSDKPRFSPFVDILFTKIYFSIHIVLKMSHGFHFLTSKTWNTLFDKQPFWIASKQIFL